MGAEMMLLSTTDQSLDFTTSDLIKNQNFFSFLKRAMMQNPQGSKAGLNPAEAGIEGTLPPKKRLLIEQPL